MGRTGAILVAAATLGAAAGCADRDGEYVTLESVFALSGGTLDGTLHWAFVQGNPTRVDDPTPVCDIWEAMAGDEVDLDPGLCPRCHAIYLVDVALDDLTCDAAPQARQVSLGFAPIESLDGDIADLQEAGFDLLVSSDWTPHDGLIDTLEPLLAARAQGGGGGLPDDTYVAESLDVWEAP